MRKRMRKQISKRVITRKRRRRKKYKHGRSSRSRSLRKSKKHKHVRSKKYIARKMRGGQYLPRYNLKYNNNPILPDPAYLHTNDVAKNMAGGGFMNDFGLGDVLTGYYKGGNALTNTYNTYNGHKSATSPSVLNQPKMQKYFNPDYKSPDIVGSYDKYSNDL